MAFSWLSLLFFSLLENNSAYQFFLNLFIFNWRKKCFPVLYWPLPFLSICQPSVYLCPLLLNLPPTLPHPSRLLQSPSLNSQVQSFLIPPSSSAFPAIALPIPRILLLPELGFHHSIPLSLYLHYALLEFSSDHQNVEDCTITVERGHPGFGNLHSVTSLVPTTCVPPPLSWVLATVHGFHRRHAHFSPQCTLLWRGC